MITTRLDKPLKDALNINPPDDFIHLIIMIINRKLYRAAIYLYCVDPLIAPIQCEVIAAVFRISKLLSSRIKKGNYKKLIFVLTDGEADDKVKCLSTVQQNISQNLTINTFGIGNDCDKQFCNQLAEEGSGICVILNNQEVSKLRSKVI